MIFNDWRRSDLSSCIEERADILAHVSHLVIRHLGKERHGDTLFGGALTFRECALRIPKMPVSFLKMKWNGVRNRGGNFSGGKIFLQLEKFPRSEEHTSELQSRQYLVCRL